MPSAYAKWLGPTLLDCVEEHTKGKTHQSMLQIYDEIALARAALSQDLKLCSAVIDSPTSSIAARQAAMSAVQSGLDKVTLMCERMAKIEENLDDKVSARQLQAFVEQIVVCVFERLTPLGEQGEEIAKALAEDVKTKIRMPTAELRAIRVRAPGSVRAPQETVPEVVVPADSETDGADAPTEGT